MSAFGSAFSAAGTLAFAPVVWPSLVAAAALLLPLSASAGSSVPTHKAQQYCKLQTMVDINLSNTTAQTFLLGCLLQIALCVVPHLAYPSVDNLVWHQVEI